MLLFQFPGVAEHWLSEDDFANFGTGHWLQFDSPDRVNALLLDFLGSRAGTSQSPAA